mmetsp:Transcript_15556/g.2591  ORF Transcript_15556/g.2591 Transcript_15556/m.2591 type:complete len:163 (+) Transcript_15556:1084-1572(+)
MKDEVYLLLRHFGEFNETRIRYSEFCKLFSPKREDYASLLRSRAGTLYPPIDKRRVFNVVTLERLIEVVRLHLESEGVAESIRQRMSSRSSFSLYEAFQALDRDRNGFVTIDEFRDVLLANGVYADIKDLESLMEIYDKNRDGRVSYSEFVQEVTPKSPRRY